MRMFNLFRRRGSALVARDRLQVLLAHERAAVSSQPDLLAILREDILEVLAKHVTVGHDNVVVRMDRGATVSTLEIDIEIPTLAQTAMPVRKRATSSAKVGARSAQSSPQGVQNLA